MLAFLLLIFIGSMVYLMNIVQKTAAITKEGLRLPARKMDFDEIVKKENMALDYDEQLKEPVLWEASVARGADKAFAFSSDLFDIPGVARCGHCRNMIPVSFFANQECPLCHKVLAPPPKAPEVIFRPGVISKEDPDGCGIPDTVKIKNGLDPSIAENALWDNDNDGFSNLYEFQCGTDMKDPANHPPLWHRLSLEGIDKGTLPVVYKEVNRMNSDDQTRWEFQINYLPNDKLSDFYRKGEVLGNRRGTTPGRIKLNGCEYRVSTEKLKDPAVITLISDDRNAKPIVMKMGEAVYSPEPKVSLGDTGRPGSTPVEVYTGRVFQMGDDSTGYESYAVRAVNRDSNVVFLNRCTGTPGNYVFEEIAEPVPVGGRIPAEAKIAAPAAKAESAADGNM